MILIQHGASWKPKMDIILNKQLAKGIIWDPRAETSTRILDTLQTDINYSSIMNLIDFKPYYRQFPDSEEKKLELIDIYPKESIDRKFLRDTVKRTKLVADNLEFQQRFPTDIILTPSLYIESFGERIIDRLEDFYIETKNSNNSEKDIFASVVIAESALSNTKYIEEFLEDTQDFTDTIDGFYLTVDRLEVSNQRYSFDPTRLLALMQLIYDLKTIGYKVIVGYTGLESVLYTAVGADYVGTGWFYSLRKFNKVQKGLEPKDSQGRQKKRYASMKVFSEVKLEEHLINLPMTLKDVCYPLILEQTSIDETITNKNNIDDINMNECYLEYFEVINKYTTLIESQTSISMKIDFLTTLLNNAMLNINSYNKATNNLDRLSNEHVKQYLKATEDFAKNNFID